MGKKETDDSKCIGNIPAENADAARQAASETGYPAFVFANATDINGRPVKGCVAVMTATRKDSGPFWRVYRRIVSGG